MPAEGRHWARECRPKAGTGLHWARECPAEGRHAGARSALSASWGAIKESHFASVGRSLIRIQKGESRNKRADRSLNFGGALKSRREEG